MNFIKKLYRAFIGAFLLLGNRKVINLDELFRGKSVAVVGPASSAYENENGAYIDGFDFVIRINKALYNLDSQNRKFLGSKTDVLFHSFYENTQSGGGDLDYELFDKSGVKYVVFPRNDRKGLRLVFNFYKKYNQARPVYCLPKSRYNELIALLNGHWPTIGYCALDAALRAETENVFITGFTFFRTPYVKGYRDQITAESKNNGPIKVQGPHDPELEYAEFLKLLAANPGKKIELDPALESIVNPHE